MQQWSETEDPSGMTKCEKTWKPGDVVRYARGGGNKLGDERTQEIVPGLFWYCGMGLGEYYAADGTVWWCYGTEATELARKDGVEVTRFDSFDGYRGVYLGD